ncbi:MAG TPA: two-component regulator propeller domain-containing protein, partial [Chitinophagaceae bacterium]|nr:two-component regulator propeller domain-containing protein [Chitinophagaceae bacterium]
MPKLFLFIITLLINKNINAQKQDELICRHINNQNGLMYGHLTSIAQDKQGYIWITGDEGLQRYDGYEFINYLHNPTTPYETLPNGRLTKVAVDYQNKLWIGSFSNGFGYYNSFNNTYKL